MKFFRIGSKVDSLSYYVAALNRDQAIATVERITGPQNPNQRVVTELSQMPDGYKLSEAVPCILEEDPEWEG